MASGDSLLEFAPNSASSPTSNYATIDIRGTGHFVLDFDATTDETAFFTGVLPNHYAGGGINVILEWMASSGTSGAARWEGAFERHDLSSLDLDADSFATAKSAGTTAPGTAGQKVRTTISFMDSEIDGLLKNETFRLKISRDADGTTGTDDLAGDSELARCYLTEV